MSIYDIPDLRPFRTIQNRMRLQGGAVVTQHGSLESDDFETGVSGWIIYGNGDVEFNDGVFRGDIVADSFLAASTLLQTWTFTGSTESWVADVGSLSSAGDFLTITDGGATPEAHSPNVAAEPGLVYGVFIEGDVYDDTSADWYEHLEFFDGALVSLGYGDWEQHGEGDGVAVGVNRYRISLAPAGTLWVRVVAGSQGATDAILDNVKVYRVGTMTGAAIDTRPTDLAPGVRVGTKVEFLNAETLTGSPFIGPTRLPGDILEPWNGEGLQIYGGDDGVNLSSLYLLDNSAAIVAAALWLNAAELYLGSEVTTDVLGAWQSYSPSNTNVTVGNGSQTARYMVIGKTCFVTYSLVFGTTTSIGTSPDFGLPFNSVSGSSQFGVAHMLDPGVKEYPGIVKVLTAADSVRVFHALDTATGNISATFPFTFGTSSQINFHLTYEIA